ncbi:MAG: hypothetical protein WCG29_00315 [Desulfomonile sp.]
MSQQIELNPLHRAMFQGPPYIVATLATGYASEVIILIVNNEIIARKIRFILSGNIMKKQCLLAPHEA